MQGKGEGRVHAGGFLPHLFEAGHTKAWKLRTKYNICFFCSPYIRAVYTRKNKPRLTLAAAYISRKRNYLYEYGLNNTPTAGINGSRLDLRPDRSSDDAICFGASFGVIAFASRNCNGSSEQQGRNDWLCPKKPRIFSVSFSFQISFSVKIGVRRPNY